MKQAKLFLILCGLILTGILIFGGVAGAAITGTAHDLSAKGWGSDQICIFCHTPHNAQTGANNLAPLWNHGSTAVSSYTLYSSSSLNAAPGQPSNNSKACLSCHDGTVAVDTYGARTGTTFMGSVGTGSGLVGTDLSNDHPISFTYNAALASADGGLVTPASYAMVVTGIPLFGGSGVGGARLECATCHNVHDNSNGDFLRTSNTASALCLTCHTK